MQNTILIGRRLLPSKTCQYNLFPLELNTLMALSRIKSNTLFPIKAARSILMVRLNERCFVIHYVE